MLDIFLIILGVGLMVVSGNNLLQHLSLIAEQSRIPKFLLGFGVLALFASLPQIILSIWGGSHAQELILPAISANIFNLLGLVGLAAILVPISVKNLVASRDIPFSLVSITTFALLASDRFFVSAANDQLTRIEGVILLVMFLVFVYYLAFSHRELYQPDLAALKKYLSKGFLKIFLSVAGFTAAGILVGETLQANSINPMIVFSFSEIILTLLAVMRREPEFALGNILGRNIVSITLIIGLTALIRPVGPLPSLGFDLIFHFFATLLVMLALFLGQRNKVERTEGFFFLAIFICYLLFSLLA